MMDIKMEFMIIIFDNIGQIRLQLTGTMSQLLLKLMAGSYCRYHDQNNLITDCLTAISGKVQSIDTLLKTQLKQIKQVLSIPSQNTQNQMSVIMQQQTQRSFTQNSAYQKWMLKTKQQFNLEIGRLDKIEKNTEKLVNIYKNQLLDISKQMAKWETKNQELKKELKKVNSLNQKLNQENNQLKDQITADSARHFLNTNEHFDSVFDPKSLAKNYQSKQGTPKFKIKNSEKDKKCKNVSKKQEQKSKFHSRLQEYFEDANKVQQTQRQREKQRQKQRERQVQRQKQSKTIQIKIRQTEIDEQNRKWKRLSKKIDQLKSKLVLYQQEIEEHKSQITKLKQTIRQLKSQDDVEGQQKRKLKTANTTLRGQKTVLQKQVATLKKSLSQKSQLCSVQQTQIGQLKIQLQNSTQTIKFQTTTISQLQTSLSKTTQKHYDENAEKIKKLQTLNKQLITFIQGQEQEIQLMDQKTRQIEQKLDNKIKQMFDRTMELETILEQKNQCIVKMKAKGFLNENINPNVPAHNQNAYLNQLVKVLTKKVADRDQVIRRLQKQ